MVADHTPLGDDERGNIRVPLNIRPIRKNVA